MVVPNRPSSDSAKKRILSSASDAFEMTSRRNTSFFWYRELMMMSIRRDTSAWNSNFSALGASPSLTKSHQFDAYAAMREAGAHARVADREQAGRRWRMTWL